METQKNIISFFFLLLVAVLRAIEGNHNGCSKSMCTDDDNHGLAIHLPFLVRHHDQTVIPGDPQREVLVKFFVKQVDYINQSIVLHNPLNCLLLKPSETTNLPNSPFSLYDPEEFASHGQSYTRRNATLLNCPTLVKRVIDDSQVPCLGGPANRVYAVTSSYELFSFFEELQSCTKMYDVLSLPYDLGQGPSGTFNLKWSTPNCTKCEAEGKKCRLKSNGTKSEIQCADWGEPKGKKCRLKSNGTKSEIQCADWGEPSTTTTRFLAGGPTLVSIILLLLPFSVFCVYKWDTKEKEKQLKIERFLEDYRALKPSRYTYADIKRITKQFKHKLGEGAYGAVFKGKLSSDLYVAVKVLNNTKGNGEEFINEVATMGRIHHVNVVRLVGFCADGFRRALLYEFLPNGSLQSFISSADDKNSFLGWDKFLDIAVGIAKGIEYLHQGCDQRILHFDIKPHNILLDHKYTPKVSDFGLSKLCSKDQSIVSMTTARGTMGYIAPEVFSRNFGNVSYKSDVYSFGMLLLEMVGGRSNRGINTDSDEVYYPEWIYNLLEEGEDVRVHIESEGDDNIPKKLAVVGLWCIQWHPVDRPSMKLAVQMLEGNGSLEVPPNPFGSAGPNQTSAKLPVARRLNLELEAIAELE